MNKIRTTKKTAKLASKKLRDKRTPEVTKRLAGSSLSNRRK